MTVLEFRRALEIVAARAASGEGKDGVLALRPIAGEAEARRELRRVGIVMDFLQERPGWTVPTAPPSARKVVEAEIRGAALDPSALSGVRAALAASRSLRATLRHAGVFAELATIAKALVALPDIEAKLDHAIGPDDEILDRSSPELGRIRHRMRTTKNRIVRRMTNFAQRLPKRLAVPNASVSVRDGRYVIPVRREGRGEVGGLVHDESRSGATLFIEPPVAIELTNELRSLERAEEREVRRVLALLTALLAPRADAIAGALDALARFDSLCARALTALAWGGSVPEISADARLRLVDGRHPFLVEGGRPVVPFTLSFDDEEHAVVVSGPNAGGKSVLLRATGLACALSRSGVVPPVGPGTSIPVFSDFFADMGDEQSIADSLSTFSAHLHNLADLLARADARSLVLLDELGAGTDPKEGGALACGVIEELAARGATVLASSHLGELKRLASPGSGIVNASLEFDQELMHPTYRFVKGRPGRSYGLTLARSSGLPRGVVERAQELLGEEETRLDELLTALQKREREAASLSDRLEIERARLSRMATELEGRDKKLRSFEKAAAGRARREARAMLLGARREIERVIRDLRREVRQDAGRLEEASRAARARVEKEAGRRSGEPELSGDGPLPRGTVPLTASDLPTLARGQELVLRANATRATVRSVRSDRVVVEIGGLRLDLALSELSVPTGTSRSRRS